MERLLKNLTIASLLGLSSISIGHAQKFNKEAFMAGVDKKIESLQKLKGCASSAQDKAAFRKCRQEHRKFMKGQGRSHLKKKLKGKKKQLKRLEQIQDS